MAGNKNSGRRPRPTALKILTGKEIRTNIDNEPFPKEKMPAKPTWLDDSATVSWNRVCRHLASFRMLAQTDADSIAAFVQCIVRLRQIKKELKENGQYYWLETTTGCKRVRNPAVTDEQLVLKQMLTFAREFGLTPSSRVGLAKLPQDNRPEDPLEDILSGVG